MVKKSFWVAYLSLCFLFTCLGCAALSTAVDNYKACKGDQVCVAEMSKVKEATYEVTRSAGSNFPVPSVPEILAFVVSNIVSLCYGVFHGSKVKKN